MGVRQPPGPLYLKKEMVLGEYNIYTKSYFYDELVAESKHPGEPSPGATELSPVLQCWAALGNHAPSLI